MAQRNIPYLQRFVNNAVFFLLTVLVAAIFTPIFIFLLNTVSDFALSYRKENESLRLSDLLDELEYNGIKVGVSNLDSISFSDTAIKFFLVPPEIQSSVIPKDTVVIEKTVTKEKQINRYTEFEYGDSIYDAKGFVKKVNQSIKYRSSIIDSLSKEIDSLVKRNNELKVWYNELVQYAKERDSILELISKSDRPVKVKLEKK